MSIISSAMPPLTHSWCPKSAFCSFFVQLSTTISPLEVFHRPQSSPQNPFYFWKQCLAGLLSGYETCPWGETQRPILLQGLTKVRGGVGLTPLTDGYNSKISSGNLKSLYKAFFGCNMSQCAPPVLSDHVLNAGSCLPRETPVVSLMDRELKKEKVSVLSPFTSFFSAVLLLNPHSVFADLSYLFHFDSFCSSNEQKTPQKRQLQNCHRDAHL